MILTAMIRLVLLRPHPYPRRPRPPPAMITCRLVVVLYFLLQDAQKIYTPLEDATLVFGQKKVISDFCYSQCHLNFRFRKTDLQDVADQLWPRLEPFLKGAKEKLILENRYTAPYETCLLLTLFRFHRPVRLRPEMEVFFGMRKSQISVAIAAFSAALYMLAIQYLEDPSFWHAIISELCTVFHNIVILLVAAASIPIV
jgi:hypothetical protein